MACSDFVAVTLKSLMPVLECLSVVQSHFAVEDASRKAF